MTKISKARKRHIYRGIKIAVCQYFDNLESLKNVTDPRSRRNALRILVVLLAEAQIQNLIFDKYKKTCLEHFSGISVSTKEEEETFRNRINKEWPGYSNYADFFLEAKKNGKMRKRDVINQSLGPSRVDSLDTESHFLITVPFIVAAIEHLINFATIKRTEDGLDEVELKRSIKTATGDVALLLKLLKEKNPDFQGAYGSMNYLRSQRQSFNQRILKRTVMAHALHCNLHIQSEIVEGAVLFFYLKPSYVRWGLHIVFILPWSAA